MTHQQQLDHVGNRQDQSDLSWSEISCFRIKPTILLTICLLLVVSSVAWRKGVYYSGGTDIVVVSKAALTLLAAALAFFTVRPGGTWSGHRATPVILLTAYLIISIVGGGINGDGLASVIIALRVGLTAAVLVLVVISHRWEEVISAVATSMVLLATVSAGTGIGSLAEEGRLYGGFPPINANEICLLMTVPVIVTFWKCLHGHARVGEFVALVPMMGAIWLTGSRTGLAAVVLVLAFMLLLAPRVPPVLMSAGLLAIPVAAYVALFTPLLTDFVGRGDPQGVTTLNSRTIAWQAALQYPESLLEKLFGHGLALKQIPVSAIYRSEQILDSSWVSAFLQVGYVGMGILLLLVLVTLVRGLGLPSPQRSLVLALTVAVTFVSILESGLFDSTPAFIVFLTASMLAHRVNPRGGAFPAPARRTLIG